MTEDYSLDEVAVRVGGAGGPDCTTRQVEFCLRLAA